MKENKKIMGKCCILCIFALFIIPTVIANNSDKNICTETVKNSGIEPLDNSEIVYARIGGSCNGWKTKGGFLIRDIEIWAGSSATRIYIDGYKRPLWNPYSHFFVDVTYVHVPRFIGYFQQQVSDVFSVTGFALGYIEWSE